MFSRKGAKFAKEKILKKFIKISKFCAAVTQWIQVNSAGLRDLFFKRQKNQGTAIKEGAQKRALFRQMPLPIELAALTPRPNCADLLATGSFRHDWAFLAGVFGV
jgi:hypothetical protein